MASNFSLRRLLQLEDIATNACGLLKTRPAQLGRNRGVSDKIGLKNDHEPMLPTPVDSNEQISLTVSNVGCRVVTEQRKPFPDNGKPIVRWGRKAKDQDRS